MNNTTTNLTAIVAVFMAATLVVGTFATVAAIQPAFAIAKKPPGHDDKKTRDNGSGNGNGNTVTIEECKNKGSASGFDTAVNQECENLICTHPGENATCVQEGIITSTSTPESTTGTLLVKKLCPTVGAPTCVFGITVTGNNPQPSTLFILRNGESQLVTLGPGTFTVIEGATGPGFTPSFSGDCRQTAPGSEEATGTISAGQHLTCTITNTFEP